MKRPLLLTLLALGIATMLGGAIAPASAQDGRHDERRREEIAREREWRAHERRAEEWRHRHDRDPGYVYAPPPVYYSAPPAAAFSLVVPLHIR